MHLARLVILTLTALTLGVGCTAESAADEPNGENAGALERCTNYEAAERHFEAAKDAASALDGVFYTSCVEGTPQLEGMLDELAMTVSACPAFKSKIRNDWGARELRKIAATTLEYSIIMGDLAVTPEKTDWSNLPAIFENIPDNIIFFSGNPQSSMPESRQDAIPDLYLNFSRHDAISSERLPVRSNLTSYRYSFDMPNGPGGAARIRLSRFDGFKSVLLGLEVQHREGRAPHVMLRPIVSELPEFAGAQFKSDVLCSEWR